MGTSLSLRGDNELVMGAPGTAETAGEVLIARLEDFQVIASLSPRENGDEFGAVIVRLPDQDGDNTEDLVIGAPNSAGRGAFYYYRSGSSSLSRVFQGTGVAERFGAALAYAGDRNGDDFPEVLVGAPEAARPGGLGGGPTGPSRARSAARATGGEQLPQVGEIMMVSVTREVLWTRWGREAYDRFGADLAVAAIDPEGLATEFIVGAPGANSNAGRAYVVGNDSEISLFVTGDTDGGRLGWFVAAGPDFTGDGLLSLAAIAPGVYEVGQSVGQTMFYNWERVAMPRLLGPLPYVSLADSPLLPAVAAGNAWLEDFEDGLFNTPGVVASAGSPLGPTDSTDSVDGDDGAIDGSGNGGWTLFSPDGPAGITFTFEPGVLRALPTTAGLAWTDGFGTTHFEAFDADGESIGQMRGDHADAFFTGETGEDRFYGMTYPGGIAAVRVWNSIGGVEVDHLQYGGDNLALPDLNDYALFQNCFGGDGGGVIIGCERFDFERDRDVDLIDYRRFQVALFGPARPLNR